jgi:hypothetical protein
MGEGSGALLEVWGTPLGPSSESFKFKNKTELVQISIQMWIYAVGGRADALPSARFLDKIKKRNFIHKKEGAHYKEEADCP